MSSRRCSEVLPEVGGEMGYVRIPASSRYSLNAPVVIPEQRFGSRHSQIDQVAMWRDTDPLSKKAYEMESADPRLSRELTQLQRLAVMLFHIF